MEIVKIDSLKSLQKFEVGEGYDEYRFIAGMAGLEIPVLVRLNWGNQKRLLVTYNGAIQRSKAPDGIVFQRSSWLDEIEASVIQISDPTLRRHQRLQIGWGQYSKENWAIDSFKELIDQLRVEFELGDPNQTTHYGSSAGGFQAACTATLDRGSRAVINNPQLDWSRYNPTFVRALLRDVFEGSTLDEVPPDRISALSYFETQQYVPQIDMYTNIASDGDVDDQLIPSLEKLRSLSIVGKKPRIVTHLYHDDALGHNPLGKPTSLKIINDSFF